MCGSEALFPIWYLVLTGIPWIKAGGHSGSRVAVPQVYLRCICIPFCLSSQSLLATPQPRPTCSHVHSQRCTAYKANAVSFHHCPCPGIGRHNGWLPGRKSVKAARAAEIGRNLNIRNGTHQASSIVVAIGQVLETLLQRDPHTWGPHPGSPEERGGRGACWSSWGTAWEVLSRHSDPTTESELMLRGALKRHATREVLKTHGARKKGTILSSEGSRINKHSYPFTDNSHIHYAFDPPAF